MMLATDTSTLKPHYRLLGMLLERQELRAKLTHFTRDSHSRFVRYDLVEAELTQRMWLLDAEIRDCYPRVLAHFADQGYSEHELNEFVGDDLVAELATINQ